MVGRVRSWCRRLGFDVAPYPSPTGHWPRLAGLLNAHEVALVVDVGANVGQYAQSLLRHGYRGRIHSYEPVAAAHAALVGAASDHAHWTVAPRTAVGDTPGEVTINVSAASDMSSILPMSPAAKRRFASDRYVGTETAPMVTLGDEIPHLAAAGEPVFVKSDTQGCDDRVLDGLGTAVDRVVGVQIELSMVAVYDGQPRYLDMLARLEGLGYAPHLIVPGYWSRQFGRMIEFDVVAFRSAPIGQD